MSGSGIAVDPMEHDLLLVICDVFFIFDTLIRCVVFRCCVMVTVDLVVINFRVGSDKLKNPSIKERRFNIF